MDIGWFPDSVSLCERRLLSIEIGATEAVNRRPPYTIHILVCLESNARWKMVFIQVVINHRYFFLILPLLPDVTPCLPVLLLLDLPARKQSDLLRIHNLWHLHEELRRCRRQQKCLKIKTKDDMRRTYTGEHAARAPYQMKWIFRAEQVEQPGTSRGVAY